MNPFDDGRELLDLLLTENLANRELGLLTYLLQIHSGEVSLKSQTVVIGCLIQRLQEQGIPCPEDLRQDVENFGQRVFGYVQEEKPLSSG